MKLLPPPDYTKHNELLRNRTEKEVYLAINTNINCIGDWSPNSNNNIQEHSAGLYLGKVVFKKNKYNNLIPKYIPIDIDETVLEDEIKKINKLWLNEINKDYIPAQTNYDNMIGEYKTFDINNIKVNCKINQDNIILNKEQIISYFINLYRLNTKLIEEHIENINVNQGIVTYMPTNEIYDKLLNDNILTKDMFIWKGNVKFPTKNGLLITLDYMKQEKLTQIVTLFDELFYPYFIYSLREYALLYFQGNIQEKNNLIFNQAAYVDDSKIINEPREYYYCRLIQDKYYKDIEQSIKDEIKFCKNAYYINNNGYFYINAINYLPNDESGFYNKTKSAHAFISPNNIKQSEDYIHNIQTRYNPSPSGNYYFELDDNRQSFVEFCNPIYPKDSNKWNAEMFEKLHLI